MSKAVYTGIENKARKVPRLYVGVDGIARKVKRGYVGVNGIARLFYAPSTRPPILPEGYTELEYLRATNNQHIKSGNVTSSVRVEMKASFQYKNGAAENSVYPIWTHYFYTMSGLSHNVAFEFRGDINSDHSANIYAHMGNDGLNGYSGDASKSSVKTIQIASNFSGPFEITLQTKDVVNCVFQGLDYTVGSFQEWFSGDIPAIRIGALSYTEPGSYYDPILPIVNIYSCKVYYGDQLKYNYIPCKNEANMVGFYDLVNEKFISSVRGNFTAGPEA